MVELNEVESIDVSVVISSVGEKEDSVTDVVEVSIEEVSVTVLGDGSDETEDVKEVVDSVVEKSVGRVSVTVLDSGSMDEMEEERSVEVLKADDSVETSVVKSVEVEKTSDEVSVVETGVEVSGKEVSVIVLDEDASEVENSVDEASVTVLDEGSKEEEIEVVKSVVELKGTVSVDASVVISGEKEESVLDVVESEVEVSIEDVSVTVLDERSVEE